MNRLPLAKRVEILSMLTEGVSMRSIGGATGSSMNTVAKLLADAGRACIVLHDELVSGLKARNVLCNEIWSFASARGNGETSGDVWTWIAFDADSRMIINYRVGDRSAQSAMELIEDLRTRLTNSVLLNISGHTASLEPAGGGPRNDMDCAQLVSLYGDRAFNHQTRSAVSNRRPPEPATTFSKKLDCHIHTLALYFMFHNFIRPNETLRMTPAMVAGVADRVWSFEDIATAIGP